MPRSTPYIGEPPNGFPAICRDSPLLVSPLGSLSAAVTPSAYRLRNFTIGSSFFDVNEFALTFNGTTVVGGTWSGPTSAYTGTNFSLLHNGDYMSRAIAWDAAQLAPGAGSLIVNYGTPTPINGVRQTPYLSGREARSFILDMSTNATDWTTYGTITFSADQYASTSAANPICTFAQAQIIALPTAGRLGQTLKNDAGWYLCTAGGPSATWIKVT